MRRLLFVFLALALFLAARPASAFHAGDVFDKPGGAGGGGGLFYVGLPTERGWNCNACHLGAPGLIRVSIDADARADLAAAVYVPEKVYALTATLNGEHEGLPHPGFNSQANFNSLVVSIVDAAGQPAGSLGGFAPEAFYSSGTSTIASAGQQVGATQWSFSWTAPQAGAGAVTIHLAAVDGNGAESPTGVTLTDPWNDDVFVGALKLAEGAGPTSQTTVLRPPAARDRTVYYLGWMPAVAIVIVARRRRAR